MSRQQDLERSIRESYDIIRQYEAVIRTSGRPEEKLRARRVIDEQWALIEGYLAQYRPLCGGVLPDDMAQLAAAAPGAEPAAPSTKYDVHIDHAEGIAIGDGARVMGAGSGTGPARMPLAPDTAAIRALLTAALTDEALTALCYDYFRPVYENLATGMSKGQKIHRLIEHCEKYDKLDHLLAQVRERNPTQYARFFQA